MSDPSLTALLIGLSTLTWWFFASTSWGNLDNAGDMAENYAWGQEWQLGYYKHPPLFAWAARAWFEIFPNQDVWYFLLSVLNVAVGLTAVWFLAGYFVRGRQRVLAVALLLLCPFYNIYAFRFNANTFALSLWPVAALAFMAALRRPTIVRGLLCGVAAALPPLTKYPGGLLLFSILAWLLVTAEGRVWLRSRSGIAAAAAFALSVAPHVWWLFSTGFIPLTYVATRIDLTADQAADMTFGFVVGQVLQLVLVLGVLAMLLGRDMVSGRVWRVAGRPDRLLLLLLSFAPFLAIAACSLALHARVSQMWGTQIWFALPLFFMAAPGLALREVTVRRALVAILAVIVVIPATGPLIYALAWTRHVKYETEPRPELARRVTELWHTRTGQKLRIVAGTQAIAETISFYSPDHPSHFIAFTYADAPWITPARLAREGMAIVCEANDPQCLAEGTPYLAAAGGWSEIALARPSVYGTGPTFRYKLAMVPPAGVSR